MEAVRILEALTTPQGRADPYPLYRRAQELGQVTVLDDSFVLVTSYEGVNQVLRSPAFGVAGAAVRDDWDPAFRDRPSQASTGASILNANPPDHGRMRSLMQSVFSPRRVAGLEPAIAEVTAGLLDAMAAEGADGSPVDFMESFAYELPVAVICELLGVPRQDRRFFRPLATDVAATLDFFQDEEVLAVADSAALDLDRYFRNLVARRRAEPADDLVTALIRARDADDGRLSETELLSNLTLLLIAGFETTTNLFGNGVRLLFDHPDVHAGLLDGSVPVGGFVEEVLRYDSPVQMTSRFAFQAGQVVAGVEVPRGAEAMVMIGAANRDPLHYAAPDAFDPLRPDINPLSFGAGPHFCLGSVLARLEASTAFPLLLDRFPKLAADGVPTRNSRLLLRGYMHLPVTLG
jgi:cytochrome P450